MWLLSLIFSTLFVSFGHGEVFDITVVELPTTITPDVGTRIIGGQPTSIERYPFTVQVLYNSRLSCGGSLITRRHVLSAGHCFVDTRGIVIAANLFTIRVGTAQLNSGGTRYSVSTIVVHEQYNRPLRNNDVAVLVLSSTVALNNRVALAPLPAQNSVVPDNTHVIHVGWGRTNENVDQAASVLNEVEVLTINLEICRARYNQLAQLYQQPYPVTNNMICAGLLDIGGRDACQGDSGGPLIYTYNINIVVGITSWGYGCAHPTYPGVSARVASYTNWINNTVHRYNSSPPLRNLSCVLILTTLFAVILNIISY